MIKEFNGDYDFLSNFYSCKVLHQVSLDNHGYPIEFPSAEHAYQAAKATTAMDRVRIQNAASAGEAKRLGLKINLRKDWEQIKIQVMQEVVLDKFTRNLDIRLKLLNTYPQKLIEENWWHDNIWGQCTCMNCTDKGQNLLGKILMKVRKELR